MNYRWFRTVSAVTVMLDLIWFLGTYFALTHEVFLLPPMFIFFGIHHWGAVGLFSIAICLTDFVVHPSRDRAVFACAAIILGIAWVLTNGPPTHIRMSRFLRGSKSAGPFPEPTTIQ
jgi:hypothetical protein